MELRKFLAPEFITGNNSIDLAGRYAFNYKAKKVLIVTDPGVIKAGWTSRIEKTLKSERIPYAIFDQLTPNPKDHEVMAGVDFFNEEKCDFLIAVGGGSVIDCAKGIGISSSNGKHITAFEGVDEVATPMPPLICIPTTAGTAADISQFAIILDTSQKRKFAIISKAVVPDVSLIDAQTTMTMSHELTAATGMDALVHAIEAFVSNASSHITDLQAREAIRLVSANLLKVLDNPMNMNLRNNMMLGSLLAGMAFSNASLGVVHAMAHSLGGFKDLAHGDCNAILLEHSIDKNFNTSQEKYTTIAKEMGLTTSKMDSEQVKNSLIDFIREFRQKAGIDFCIKEYNITEQDLYSLAEKAYHDPCLATNPKELSIREIEELYARIF